MPVVSPPGFWQVGLSGGPTCTRFRRLIHTLLATAPVLLQEAATCSIYGSSTSSVFWPFQNAEKG